MQLVLLKHQSMQPNQWAHIHELLRGGDRPATSAERWRSAARCQRWRRQQRWMVLAACRCRSSSASSAASGVCATRTKIDQRSKISVLMWSRAR